MRTYATTADLQKWVGVETKLPQNAPALLRSASGLVERSTVWAVYRTDSEGLPVDRAVRDAFRDAVAAQAAYWIDLGVNPTLGAAALAPVVASKAVNGVSIGYAINKDAAKAKANASTTLAPDAVNILGNAGLLSGRVRSY